MPSNKDALEEMKAFLESAPPNVSVRISGLAKERVSGEFGASRYWELVGFTPSRLDLHCNVDDGVRRFSAPESNRHNRGYQFLEYVCRDCGEYSKTYALLTQLESTRGDGIPEIMKLGEFPPFSAPISARIQTLLNKDDLELYQKGSRSEAQGLGIGAATYFRRIVESHWKRLVTKLRDAARKLGHDDLTAFDDALKEVRFSAAVDKLKDAIPDNLTVRSTNPGKVGEVKSVGTADLAAARLAYFKRMMRNLELAMCDFSSDLSHKQKRDMRNCLSSHPDFINQWIERRNGQMPTLDVYEKVIIAPMEKIKWLKLKNIKAVSKGPGKVRHSIIIHAMSW